MKRTARHVDSPDVSTDAVSVTVLVALARAMGRLDTDPKAFLVAAGVSEPFRPTDYVPAGPVNRALERVARSLNTDCLGMHLALACPPGSLGMLDYGLLASRDLEDGLARAARWYGLFSRRMSIAFHPRANPPQVSLVSRVSDRTRFWPELVFGAFVLRLREAIGDALKLEGVQFRHAGKLDPLHRSVFRAPVSFDQPVDGLFFDKGSLSAPFRTADAATAAALDASLTRLRTLTTAKTDSLPDRAKAALVTQISDRGYDITRLAKHLGMSVRTLQRKLQDEGSSHREILDAARKQVALDLIVRPDVSPEHVASTVGFAGSRAFYRAFSRWTGMTPAEYRAEWARMRRP